MSGKPFIPVLAPAGEAEGFQSTQTQGIIDNHRPRQRHHGFHEVCGLNIRFILEGYQRFDILRDNVNVYPSIIAIGGDAGMLCEKSGLSEEFLPGGFTEDFFQLLTGVRHVLFTV